MKVAQAIVESVEALPAEKQQEVLDFVEFLKTRESTADSDEAKHKKKVRALAAAMRKGPIKYLKLFVRDDLYVR